VTNAASNRGWISGACLGASAPVLTIMIALAVVATSAQAQRFKVLYKFKGGANGFDPAAPLLRDAAGNLYGTTFQGGQSGRGVVFRLTPNGSEETLYSFTYPTGGNSLAGLVRDQKGNLYGTTLDGGAAGFGTVFKLDTTSRETVLHNFAGGTDGQYPWTGVIRDEIGNIYGTTAFGGGGGCGGNGYIGCGTVFKVEAGNETILHDFASSGDGTGPVAVLMRDRVGTLYGTTVGGGDPTCDSSGTGCGTVFKLEATGQETVLYSFRSGAGGKWPEAAVTMDAAGNLYGTTGAGGDFKCDPEGCGVVFKLDRTGKRTVLHTFTGGSDGEFPYGGVILDAEGNLYGTTVYGGTGTCSDPYGPGCGLVFKVDPGGKETVLHTFTGGADGANPHAGLVRDTKGRLYGTTESGGNLKACDCSDCTPGCGVVFRITPK
jgi:uncharacterized repeat protein (TIGR03803 family)